MSTNIKMVQVALSYALVRQQRQAIETSIKLLNEAASQATTAGVKAPHEWLQLRNILNEKDSQLQLEEYDLHFKLTRTE